MQEFNRIRTTVNFEFIDVNFSDCRGIVLPGGTRSAKTISVLQWIVYYCLTHTGKKIIIARDKLATLKETTLLDFEAVCRGEKGCDAMYPQLHVRDRASSPHAYINGNIIKFVGLNDDPMRVHGMDCDIFYINEAVGCYASSFKQLNQRCRVGFILDCNPSEPNSWVYDLERRPNVRFFRSTYLDNPFLPKSIIDEIEASEPTHPEDRHLPFKERRPHPVNIANGTADAKMWDIYGLGIIHKGKEIIYPDWDTYSEEPEGYDYVFYGLDWGWNDPLAVVKITINDRDLYAREICYASELELPDLIDILKKEQLLLEQRTYLVCDTNAQQSQKELTKAGLPATKANKPPGSIMDGIRKIQGYRLHLHEDSHNLQYEANNYKFKVDPKTEAVMDIPVDKNNHGMDAIRMPVVTFL